MLNRGGIKQALLLLFLAGILLIQGVVSPNINIDISDLSSHFQKQPSTFLGGLVDLLIIILLNSLLFRLQVAYTTVFIASILAGAVFGVRFMTIGLLTIFWYLCLAVEEFKHFTGYYKYMTNTA